MYYHKYNRLCVKKDVNGLITMCCYSHLDVDNLIVKYTFMYTPTTLLDYDNGLLIDVNLTSISEEFITYIRDGIGRFTNGGLSITC